MEKFEFFWSFSFHALLSKTGSESVELVNTYRQLLPEVSSVAVAVLLLLIKIKIKKLKSCT